MDDDAIESDPRREAVDWLHRLRAGRATHADMEALKLWRARSPAHEEAFTDARALWKEFGPAARNLRQRGEISQGLAPAYSKPHATTRRAIIAGGLAATSAAAAYALVHPPLNLWPSFAELTADYRTATGEQRQFAFQSDVSVRMNTQTSVARRPSEGDADRLELIAGEASFVSMPGLRQPFTVFAADGRITANRAHFDVRHTGRGVCVTCIDGAVDVELRNNTAAVSAGQQVNYDHNGLEGVVSADIELVTAWQQGVLIFRLTPLSEVVEEINRYRPGKVILIDTELARKAINGRFRIDHMDEILIRLQQAFGIDSRSLPGGIVLLS